MNHVSTPVRIATHAGDVGGLAIRRALPTRARPMVGAWCFLDHLGPATLGPGQQMRVAPHPHIGLQTFSWMIEGEILHRDSLGYAQVIRPGQVNLMTAGRGIAHSEELLPGSARLHMTQLWIALPEAHRHMAPAFEHHPVLPIIHQDDVKFTVIAGTSLDETAPMRFHTPLFAIDVVASVPARTELPVDPGFEHGVLVLDGEAIIEGEVLSPGTLLYLAPGRTGLRLSFERTAQLLVVGGAPFEEDVLLWWNFVARNPDEITAAATDWNTGGGPFGTVPGYDGAPLVAPDPGVIRTRHQT
jgi:redox-sensitive bicupin YhaK (pirin superfamily)